MTELTLPARRPLLLARQTQARRVQVGKFRLAARVGSATLLSASLIFVACYCGFKRRPLAEACAVYTTILFRQNGTGEDK